MFVVLLQVIALAASVSGGVQYCPSAGDITVAYGSPEIFDQGWQIQGGGGAATKASFNLIPGSVDFDIDFSGVHTGVNANIYTISPSFSGPFKPADYCDGAKPAGPTWCVEIDWVESNGNCGGQTTIHTRPGPGSNGCTAWGCGYPYHYNGRAQYHMRIEYGPDGSVYVTRDGQTIWPNMLNPVPQDQDRSTLIDYYKRNGAVIYSTQWVGWVPVPDCGTSGDLPSSHFRVSNLIVNGTVVNGPTPRQCSQKFNSVTEQ